MYNKEEYIRDYGYFEQWCQDHGFEGVKALEESYPYRSKTRNELYFFREIRNFLEHNPRTKERIQMTDDFKIDFRKFSKRFMVELDDVAISVNDIFMRQISDTIGPTIRIMKERMFTHTPIMNGQKVWGVFSENTLFNLAENDGFSNFNANTSFLDIASYITAYGSTSVYDFISPDVSLEDVKKVFRKATHKGRQLEVLYITTTGRQDGDLVGMLTIWDLATIY